jgi:curved DNA-binding protein CbpA
MNPYKILGVSKEAAPEEIKQKFRKLSKKHHPDMGGDEDTFMQIKFAYDVLSNEEKRKHFDEFGFVDEINDHFIKKIVMQKLVEICQIWVDGVEKCATTNNRIKPLTVFFKHQIREVKGQLKQKDIDLKMIKRDLEKVYKKVSHKKNDNTVIHNLIEQKLKNIKVQQYQLKCDKIIFNQLEEMLNDFEYKEDAEDQLLRLAQQERTTTFMFGGTTFTF